jgi:hypothetical protein
VRTARARSFAKGFSGGNLQLCLLLARQRMLLHGF